MTTGAVRFVFRCSDQRTCRLDRRRARKRRPVTRIKSVKRQRSAAVDLLCKATQFSGDSEELNAREKNFNLALVLEARVQGAVELLVRLTQLSHSRLLVAASLLHQRGDRIHKDFPRHEREFVMLLCVLLDMGNDFSSLVEHLLQEVAERDVVLSSAPLKQLVLAFACDLDVTADLAFPGEQSSFVQLHVLVAKTMQILLLDQENEYRLPISEQSVNIDIREKRYNRGGKVWQSLLFVQEFSI
jgi:hypothetical protein